MTDNYTAAALYGMKNFNSKVREKVKKEMGNLKLIELLNKYRTEKGERNLNEFEVSQTLDSLNYLRLFIKWLVDNDKIDFNKMEEKSEYTFLKKRGGEHIIEDVLMLLSIQDSPVEFLCGILR